MHSPRLLPTPSRIRRQRRCSDRASEVITLELDPNRRQALGELLAIPERFDLLRIHRPALLGKPERYALMPKPERYVLMPKPEHIALMPTSEGAFVQATVVGRQDG